MTDYVDCDKCHLPMLGIFSYSLRCKCYGCGGSSAFATRAHDELVLSAMARNRAWESHPPCRDDRGRAA